MRTFRCSASSHPTSTAHSLSDYNRRSSSVPRRYFAEKKNDEQIKKDRSKDKPPAQTQPQQQKGVAKKEPANAKRKPAEEEEDLFDADMEEELPKQKEPSFEMLGGRD